MGKVEDVMSRCTGVLPGHGPERGLKTVLQELADSLEGTETADNYGEGAFIADFEAECAALFGKEAAVFMPSGTMAQQIGLRIWCGRRGNIEPNPPHTNFFQLFIQGDHEALTERHLALAEETGTFLFYGLRPSEVPGVAMTEIHCWENSMRFDVEALRPFLERLVGGSE